MYNDNINQYSFKLLLSLSCHTTASLTECVRCEQVLHPKPSDTNSYSYQISHINHPHTVLRISSFFRYEVSIFHSVDYQYFPLFVMCGHILSFIAFSLGSLCFPGFRSMMSCRFWSWFFSTVYHDIIKQLSITGEE